MRALRICRRCRKRLAEACVCDAMAASQLRGRLIPMADARKRRVSAVEPMKLGLAEAARPLSAAHWVRGMEFAILCSVCTSVAHRIQPSSPHSAFL